jgi:xylulokinase
MISEFLESLEISLLRKLDFRHTGGIMYLGIDCSTQSLKLLVINELRELVKEIVVVYDEHLPKYQTQNGIMRHSYDNDGRIEHISTPTLLFVDALELCIEMMKADGFDLSTVKAISASGQQHGSVWWKNKSSELLRQTLIESVSGSEPTDGPGRLSDHLASAFSLDLSPIWMDSSTTVECSELTASVGSARHLAELTGSRAYERFTGAQIKHIAKYKPDVYANTERISLISSLLPTLLVGNYAPIDLSDASGMNMLDIHNKHWHQALLDAIAPDLAEKLGKPVPSDSKLGTIASYWCAKYGFASDCEIYCASGDNPCSLIGLGLNVPGNVGISLGTSDVLFAVTADPKPNADEGSILIHPEDASNYMMMLVYKNGATTRKYVRDAVHGHNNNDNSCWIKFNESIRRTPVGCNGHIGFYYIEQEITPSTKQSGIVKFDDQHTPRLVDNYPVVWHDADCRAIIESQVLSYKHHSLMLGLSKVSSIIVTGGGSVNREILQIIADIFEMPVSQSSIANTAAKGAAIRAFNAHNKRSRGQIDSIADSGLCCLPNKDNFPIYRDLFSKYPKLESLAVDFLNRMDKSDI